MKTNQNKLVKQSVVGRVHHPTMGTTYRVGYDGEARILPNTGGITYELEVGDICMGLVGDHVEPGVSSKNADKNEDSAYNHLACIGNEAIVISGDAKGAVGRVTGKHGGIDHVMIYFDQDTLNKLAIDDKIQVKAYGQGFELDDYPDVKIMNIDPNLFAELGIKDHNGTLEVQVVTTVPAHLMGSGIGVSTSMSGDYDIMTHDQEANEKHNLNNLRFGDLVMVEDHYAHHGPAYLKGSRTIGVVVHGDSFSSGHGPGLTVIMTSKDETIKPIISDEANIAPYIKKSGGWEKLFDDLGKIIK